MATEKSFDLKEPQLLAAITRILPPAESGVDRNEVPQSLTPTCMTSVDKEFDHGMDHHEAPPLSPVPPTSSLEPLSRRTNGLRVQDDGDESLESSRPMAGARGDEMQIEAELADNKTPRRSSGRLKQGCDSKLRQRTGSDLNMRQHDPNGADAMSSASSKRKRSPSVGGDTPGQSNTRSRRSQARQAEVLTIRLNDEDFYPPYTPLNCGELQKWKGWVDVESEPIYMNAILRSLGVQGVRAEEIHDLEFSLATLPPPVYGLIFLFQYQDSDHVSAGGTCPQEVWFANQLPATNACATIALINILMNAKNVELGKPLSFFKDNTYDMTPVERAHCLNEHEFIRGVHNSFASRLDVMLADRVFASKYGKAVQAQKQKLRDQERAKQKAERDAARAARGLVNSVTGPEKGGRVSTTKRKKKGKQKKDKYCDDTSSGDELNASDDNEPKPAIDQDAYDNESAYHYVAYVPVAGHIWYLDGMSAHPQDLGEYTHPDSWLLDAAPHLTRRMAEFESFGAGGVMFNLMALVRDGRVGLREELATNVKTILAVESRLNSLQEDWRNLAQKYSVEPPIVGPDPEVGLTQTLLEIAPTPPDSDSLSTPNIETSLTHWAALAEEIKCLKDQIRVQNVSELNEESTVAKDRMDLNPVIQSVLLDLESNGVLGELLNEFKE